MARGPMGNKKGAKLTKENLKTLPKLLKYLFKYYKVQLIIVLICLIISAIISSSNAIFLNWIINTIAIKDGNGYIIKTLEEVKKPLLTILITMASVYIVGIIANFIYTQIMAVVGQGFLNRFRKDMFNHMEELPISYFDRNPHGDIMSRYTNDIDALRQFITQTLIQVITTGITIITIVALMLYYSVWLALISFAGVFLILLIIKNVGSNSARYFMKMQISTGMVEGYIEPLTRETVGDIVNRGGTILGSARLPEFKDLEVRKKAIAQ